MPGLLKPRLCAESGPEGGRCGWWEGWEALRGRPSWAPGKAAPYSFSLHAPHAPTPCLQFSISACSTFTLSGLCTPSPPQPLATQIPTGAPQNVHSLTAHLTLALDPETAQGPLCYSKPYPGLPPHKKASFQRLPCPLTSTIPEAWPQLPPRPGTSSLEYLPSLGLPSHLVLHQAFLGHLLKLLFYNTYALQPAKVP